MFAGSARLVIMTDNDNDNDNEIVRVRVSGVRTRRGDPCKQPRVGLPGRARQYYRVHRAQPATPLTNTKPH